jgi:hypothetical protein
MKPQVVPPDTRYTEGAITAITLSPDATQVAVTDSQGRLLLWDAKLAKAPRVWKFPGAIKYTAFSADGTYLATANVNGTIYLSADKSKSVSPAYPSS